MKQHPMSTNTTHSGPYDNEACNQFVEDMARQGFPVRHYRGRSFWEGPAVVTDREEGIEEQDLIRATKVRLQQDNMGLETIWYPVASGKLKRPQLMPL
jgi:hypothetical protein